MKTAIETLRSSATVATAKTDTGTALKMQRVFTEALILLDVTAAATDANDTLDVYIDVSPDGGTTWVNVGHFTQVLGNGGAKKFVMALRSDNPGASAVFDVTSNASAGATRQIGIADRIRYRGVTVDPTGSNLSFTYSVTAFLK